MVTFRKPQKTGGAAIKPISDSEKHHISPRNDAFHTSIKPVSYYNKARFARRSGLYFYPVLLKTLYANGLCKPSKTRVFAAGSTVTKISPYFRVMPDIHSFLRHTSCIFIHILPRASIHAPPHTDTAFTSATASRNPLPCTYVVSRCRPLRPCVLTHAPPLFKNKQQLKNKINTADSTKFIIFARS